MALELLETLREHGFPRLAWELDLKTKCIIYSDPRKDRWGELLVDLLHVYAGMDKRSPVEVPTAEGGSKWGWKGNSYLIVCPGYTKAQWEQALKQLDSTQFTLQSIQDGLPSERRGKKDVEKTQVYVCTPLALANRLDGLGRRGMGFQRIILLGLETELVSQTWKDFSYVVTRLAKFAQLRPPLVMVLSHPDPIPIVQWCEYLGLEPTVIQHQKLHLDLQQAIATTFATGGDLQEHAEQWGVEHYGVYSPPPTKAAFIFQSNAHRLEQKFRVPRPSQLGEFCLYIRTKGALKSGGLLCSVHKIEPTGRVEALTSAVTLSKDDPKYWKDSRRFIKCRVDFSALDVVLDPNVSYVFRLSGVNIIPEIPNSGICVGEAPLPRREEVSQLSRNGGVTWWIGGRPVLLTPKHLDLSESPTNRFDVIYVHGHRFIKGMELARVAAFVNPGGKLFLVNFKKQWRSLIQRQFELCPQMDDWYMEAEVDVVLDGFRSSKTKKQFRNDIKRTYPAFILAQKARVAPDELYGQELAKFYARVDRTFKRVTDDPDDLKLICRCTSVSKPSPLSMKENTTQAHEEMKIFPEASDQAESIPTQRGEDDPENEEATGVPQTDPEAVQAAPPAPEKGHISGYFRLTEVGRRIVKDLRRAKEYLQLFTQLKTPLLSESQKMQAVERLAHKEGKTDAINQTKQGLTFGQQARRSLRAKLWVYKTCHQYGPEYRIPTFEELFRESLQEKTPEPEESKRVPIRFTDALNRIIRHLYGLITTSSLQAKSNKVELTRILWYQQLAQQIGVPERSVNHLLNLFFNPIIQSGVKLLAQLTRQLPALPRGIIQVLKTCRLTTYPVGRGRPRVVLECRFQARGVLVPFGMEGYVCRQCGMYGREDRSCTGWYNLRRKRKNYLPMTLFKIELRATYGALTPNSMACEWFVPRKRGQTLAQEAFEPASGIGPTGRMVGWKCHRSQCTELLHLPKVGQVVTCPACKTRYKGRLDGRITIQLDYHREVQRLAQHYAGVPFDLPEIAPPETHFVLVGWNCQGRLEGDQLLVTYQTGYTEEFALAQVQVMVHSDELLATALEARGVSVRFLGLKPPRHPEVSESWVQALAECTRFETFRRKNGWGLLLSYLIATLELRQESSEFQAGAEVVLEAQLRILHQFVKQRKFSPGAFLACEGRLAKVVETFVREVILHERPKADIVREGIGRTFGRKGDRLYAHPTHAAAGKTKLDAAQNRASKILRNKLRASNAESEYKTLWLGYETVELFTHKTHDNPTLAAHLDLEEPSQRLLGNRVVWAFMRGALTAEHFQEYRSVQGFPRCAPSPWGSRKLDMLTTAFLEDEIGYRGQIQSLVEAHAAHVIHLLECIQKNYPRGYQPFIPISPRVQPVEVFKKIRKLLIEFPKELGLYYKWVEDVPRVRVGTILGELQEVLRGVETGIAGG